MNEYIEQETVVDDRTHSQNFYCLFLLEHNNKRNITNPQIIREECQFKIIGNGKLGDTDVLLCKVVEPQKYQGRNFLLQKRQD